MTPFENNPSNPLAKNTFCTRIVSPLVFALAISLPLAAQSATWTGTVDDNYSTPGNWDPTGVPAETADAEFSLNETYTVDFTDDEKITEVNFRNGNVTVDLNGFTFDTTRFRVDSGAFVTVSGGTMLQTQTTDFSGVGRTSTGGTGELLFTGPNTSITSAYMRVGQQNRGVLRFEDGASGNFESSTLKFTIGRAANGYGTLHISGVNSDDPDEPQRSKVTTDSQLIFGSLSNGRGALFVEDGGELKTGGRLVLAIDNGQGIAVASGTNSEITVDGIISVSSGVANSLDSWLISRSGGHVSSVGDIDVHQAGHVAGDSTIELLSDGVLRNGGLVAPGDPTLSYTNLSFTRNYTAAIGSLTIDGNYIQQLVAGDNTYLGTLRIKVASESSHDHLNVTGDATLAGILDLVDFGGATLFAGDELQILTWGGTLTGTFSSIETFELGEGLSWDFDRLYTEGIISVIPEPSTLAFVITLVAAGLLRLRRRRAG